MADTTDGYRYWAFISYSSKDSKVARKLHKKLETYNIPRDLVGRPGRYEPVPRRLFPIFRDRDELPLSADLGASIEDALRASRYLIVLCSRNSATSRWVNEEIRYFKVSGQGGSNTGDYARR
ncbi:MAG: toll/interleukin-1 receptor domain-containing protein [Bacteroidetes bacterium]|nr:toll/interleukin-1 receptor domain-containing protein [Bacteroidota bacterium]